MVRGGSYVAVGLLAMTGCASSSGSAPKPAATPLAVRVDTVVHVDTVRRTDTVERPAPAAAQAFSLKAAPGALSLAARRGGGSPLDHVPEIENKQQPDDEQFGHCPADGESKSGGAPSDPELNRHKNRVDEPANGQYYFVSHGAITELDSPHLSRNRDKWSQGDRDAIAKYEGVPVQVEGYLAVDPPPHGAKQESGESPNCYSINPDSVDFHIWLNPVRNGDRSSAIVVEMTPRVRTAKHRGTWTVAKLRRASQELRRVRVSGWLMFDQEHPEQLQQTRTTLWEIHPIIEFEVETDPTGEFVPLSDWTPN